MPKRGFGPYSVLSPWPSALRRIGVVAVAVGFAETAVPPLNAQFRLLVARDLTAEADRFTLRVEDAGRELV